ncbi:hypothetical protein A3C37_04445 [Candidatus Peribacteria bacterium RIFCSPHIGHO2_02_FULL_53_20]|nr:MAG: hypothetical protein A3C37_04445 [Candidatus Peribacteria bacterium RIFCSPHIGHO2_02_FULL_53_20]OGJ68052.1 MAG: hypothetical protein A3B61_02315 [Candidatus Peribacteria bacterium RIFCSPLOWO2_01_FULL_53_10]
MPVRTESDEDTLMALVRESDGVDDVDVSNELPYIDAKQISPSAAESPAQAVAQRVGFLTFLFGSLFRRKTGGSVLTR